jgi:hypothetical protein
MIDRLPRRAVMIAADLASVGLLVTVPAAAALHVLHIEQLYAVAFVFGLLQMGFNLAFRACLPGLVGAEALVEANAKLSASESVAEIGAPALGGAIVQGLGGPLAVFVDSLTFLWSACFEPHTK